MKRNWIHHIWQGSHTAAFLWWIMWVQSFNFEPLTDLPARLSSPISDGAMGQGFVMNSISIHHKTCLQDIIVPYLWWRHGTRFCDEFNFDSSQNLPAGLHRPLSLMAPRVKTLWWIQFRFITQTACRTSSSPISDTPRGKILWWVLIDLCAWTLLPFSDMM